MVRSKIPGGKLTSEQLLAELDLCDEVGNTTLRITSRQGLQLHGVVKSNLKRAIARINEIQLSTLGACGDVNRNVMCCPAPYQKNIYRQTQALADQLAAHFAPRTRAYHEIWLTDSATGEKQLVGGATDGDGFDVEPIYGKFYMPRKFKMAIGYTFDNCVDLYANDLGLMAVTEGDEIVGYNLLAGGGMGVTPSAKKTFPAVAKRICYVSPDEVLQGRRSGLQGAARFRQPRRPQAGPPEVRHRQLGRREVQGQGRGVLRRAAGRSASATTCTASTTTWAGTSKATAAGSMA